MFSVFDYNTLVSSRALETIWNKDSLETEELLMGKEYHNMYIHVPAAYFHTCIHSTIEHIQRTSIHIYMYMYK